jgi:serine O-acetyltransferase
MKFLGVEIPMSVKIGKNLQLPHWAYGAVIHPKVEIGDNVRIYQGVTIGRADIYRDDTSLKKIIIEDGVILCAGAKLLVKQSCVVEAGTVLGANSVLIVKGDRVEKGVYAGVPARKIKSA